MKDFFKITIVFTIMFVLASIAIWGFITFNSETEFGWKIWGSALFYGIAVLPASVFWRKKISYVIDLED